MRDRLKKLGRIWPRTIRYFCEYMLILLVVLECNSTYRCVFGRPNLPYELKVSSLVFGALLLFALLWEDKRRCKYVFESSILICAILLFEILFLFFNVINTIAVLSYMLEYLMFLPLMIIIFKIYHGMGEAYRLLYLLTNIVYILACCSLVIWIMAIVLGMLPPVAQIQVDWALARDARNYYNLGFFWQTEKIPFIGSSILRNTGIFPEAPMYNIFLNTALYTELFLKNKTKWVKCLLLSFTVFTTIGTIGILLCILGWGIRFFISKKNVKLKRAGYGIVFMLGAAGGLLLRQKWNLSQGSFATHIDDYLASFKAWMVNPIIGCGYENELFIQQYMSEFRIFNPGLSNSIAVVLAEGGLVLFTFFLIPFILVIVSSMKAGEKKNIWWAMGIFGIYVTTIFHGRFFMFLILAFGYSCACVCFSPQEGLKCSCLSLYSDITEYKVEEQIAGIIAVLISVGLMAISLVDNLRNLVIYYFDYFQIGLEKSQRRPIFIAMVVCFCISVIRSMIVQTSMEKQVE